MFSDRERRKANKIRTILSHLQKPNVDVDAIRKCAVTEFGFVNNTIRKTVWPLLLNIKTDEIIDHTSVIKDHEDTDQVTKDVERSMWRFTKGMSKLRNQKRQELTRIINAVLSQHEELHYFQGYHEIGSILLLVTDERLSYAMLERLSLYHLRDNMLPTFSEVSKILNLMFPLLSFVDKDVFKFITNSQVQPMFAISWIITWFSHNFEELDPITRLFDYFLASHPLIPLYFSVILIVHLKKDLLKLDCAYDAVHSFFSNLPEELPLDLLIKQTQSLYEKIPPMKLQEKEKLYLEKTSPMTTYPFDWMAKGKPSKSGIKSPKIYFVVGTLVLCLSMVIYQTNKNPSWNNFSEHLLNNISNNFKHFRNFIGY